MIGYRGSHIGIILVISLYAEIMCVEHIIPLIISSVGFLMFWILLESLFPS